MSVVHSITIINIKKNQINISIYVCILYEQKHEEYSVFTTLIKFIYILNLILGSSFLNLTTCDVVYSATKNNEIIRIIGLDFI